MAAYTPCFQVIEQDQLFALPADLDDVDTDDILDHPIIIDYTSDPPAVTPFRAE